MKPYSKFDTGVFVYNYLRNLYDLPYHEALDNENLIWGFTSANYQTCIVNPAAFDNSDTVQKVVSDHIEKRQAAKIKLITSTNDPATKVWTELGFGLNSCKSILKYANVKKTNKKHIADFRLEPVKHPTELNEILKLKCGDVFTSVLKESVDNLTQLISKSLITVVFIYKLDSECLVGYFTIFRLKDFTILELMLCSSAHVDEKRLLQLLELVKRDGSLNDAKTLVLIIPEKWAAESTAKMIKLGEIRHYEKADIKNALLPIDTCSKSAVLKTKAEFLNAVNITNALGLPKHNDLPKNWDTLAALSQIINNSAIKKSSAILDAGGEYYSAMLYQLACYGYSNLHCVNLAFTSSKKINNITYQQGDITKTTFYDNTFSVITCLSVIEHIVSIEAYFIEMNRILKCDGILFISTDYWDKAIKTDGKKSYGAPIKIYDSQGIIYLIGLAKKHGFELTESIDLSCEDKVVFCDGFKYTFIYLTFIKK
jgi:Methyltransferase domain